MAKKSNDDLKDTNPTRRSFLAGLFAFPSIVFLGLSTRFSLWKFNRSNKSEAIALDEFFIAGYRFYNGEEVESILAPKKRLQAEREPDNPHDARAVALYFKGIKLGYVPMRRNRVISKLMDGDFDLRYEIKGVDSEASPWERVRVIVYVQKPDSIII